MITINFKVVAKTRTEDAEGTAYQMRMKSKEGHRLILKATAEGVFRGYIIGETLIVEIKNPQKTLEAPP